MNSVYYHLLFAPSDRYCYAVGPCPTADFEQSYKSLIQDPEMEQFEIKCETCEKLLHISATNSGYEMQETWVDLKQDIEIKYALCECAMSFQPVKLPFESFWHKIQIESKLKEFIDHYCAEHNIEIVSMDTSNLDLE